MAAIAEVPITLEGGNGKIAEFAKQLSAEGESPITMKVIAAPLPFVVARLPFAMLVVPKDSA